MNLRKAAAALGAAGLTIGLLGAGISATYTDSATAVQNIKVGTFSCQLTTTTPNAVVSNNGHTVTFTEPEIQQSAPQQGGNAQDLNVTVTNMSTMAATLHWSIVGPDYNIAPYNQPPYNTVHSVGPPIVGTFGTSNGSPSMLTDVQPFLPGASKTYTGLGFQWLTPLMNSDLGAAVTATYTANCTDYAIPASKILFVGTASAASATVALPSGWQVGDMAIALGMGGSPAYPSGWTAAYPGFVNIKTLGAYKVLAAGDTGVTITGASKTVIAVYRGVAAIGNGGQSGFGNNDYGSCNLAAGNVSVVNGSSWVLCVGGEMLGTNLSTTPAVGTPVFPATLRSAGIADTHFWVGDTNGGVTSWNLPQAPGAPSSFGNWQTGYYNPTTGGGSYALELLSK